MAPKVDVPWWLSDFRCLNNVTVDDRYSIPHRQYLSGRLGGTAILFKVSGYPGSCAGGDLKITGITSPAFLNSDVCFLA